MRFGYATPVVPARDIDAAIEFYRTRLGFEALFKVGEPAEYAGVRRDGVEVHFIRCAEPRIAEWTSYRIHVDGIEDWYLLCRAQNILHPNGDLDTKPWGTREFGVIDQDGVLITFWQVAR